jgi:hypothetical protein
VLKAYREQQVLLVLPARQVLLDQVLQVLLGQVDLQVHLDRLDLQAEQVLLVQALLVLRAPKEQLVLQVQQDLD